MGHVSVSLSLTTSVNAVTKEKKIALIDAMAQVFLIPRIPVVLLLIVLVIVIILTAPITAFLLNAA